MPFCDFCEAEFDSMGVLARHIKKMHGVAAREAEPQKGAQPCPICGLRLPWTIANSQQLTVCPRCLSWYYLDNGNLEQPPPERCINERLRLPCTAPEHKYYYEQYMKKQEAV